MSVEEGVGEDVDVHFEGVLDLVAAAAAAAFGVGGVVEAVARIDQDDFVAEGQALEGGVGRFVESWSLSISETVWKTG